MIRQTSVNIDKYEANFMSTRLQWKKTYFGQVVTSPGHWLFSTLVMLYLPQPHSACSLSFSFTAVTDPIKITLYLIISDL